jgi:Tol biopolymer transport system component
MMLAAVACDNSPTSPSGGVRLGYVKVSVITTGSIVDGALAIVSDSSLMHVTANASTIFQLPEGVHSIELKGIADNCLLQGSVVRSVSVRENDTTLVVFKMHCYVGPPAGVIAFVEGGTLMLLKGDAPFGTALTRGWSPSWSRDGKRIVYSTTDCDDVGCSGSLAIVDAATHEITPLPATASGIIPAWAPDVDVIAYTNAESGDLYLYGIGANKAFKIELEWPVRVSHPSFSPSGGRIVATCGERDYRSHICVFNLDGTDLRYLLPESETNDYNPSWSPDGTQIVFQRQAGRAAMYVVNADGSNLRSLPANGTSPSWSPDSRKIIFAGVNGIFTINSDGTALTQLTNGIHYSPVWKRE